MPLTAARSLAALFCLLALPASAADFSAHQAAYDVKTASIKPSSAVQNVSGVMYYEWQTGCESWTSKQNMRLVYAYSESESTRFKSDFTSIEARDGTRYSFSGERGTEGEAVQQIRGSVDRDPDGGGGRIRFSLPKNANVVLPDGGYLPTAHTLAVVAAAQKGETFLRSIVFDGGDGEGPDYVTTVIGKRVEPKADEENPLLRTPAWRVRMAYFKADDDASEAEYEMTAVLHENGIISAMRVDYEEFSVEMNLRKLVALKAPNCDK